MIDTSHLNPEKPPTIGEAYGPAMEITEQADADAYFEALVALGMALAERQGTPLTREQAEANVRSSLGYYAGYYSLETRARVERLFLCAHPVFGAIANAGAPTAAAAFGAGLARGSR